MTIKTVKVVQVEVAKAGKVDRIVLHYVGTDGDTWKIGALATELDADSRKTLAAAKGGDSLSIEITKDGNYWNLIKASPAESSTSTTTSAYSKTPASTTAQNRTDVKIQVMNALTNSVVSLGAGKTTKEYKDRVIEFVMLGNDVVELVLGGGLTKLNTPADSVVSNDVVPEIGF